MNVRMIVTTPFMRSCTQPDCVREDSVRQNQQNVAAPCFLAQSIKSKASCTVCITNPSDLIFLSFHH